MAEFDRGWLRAGGDTSLSDVHRSIKVRSDGTKLRRALAFFGPGYLEHVH